MKRTRLRLPIEPPPEVESSPLLPVVAVVLLSIAAMAAVMGVWPR